MTTQREWRFPAWTLALRDAMIAHKDTEPPAVHPTVVEAVRRALDEETP